MTGRAACSNCGGNGAIPGLVVMTPAGDEIVVDELCSRCGGSGVERTLSAFAVQRPVHR